MPNAWDLEWSFVVEVAGAGDGELERPLITSYSLTKTPQTPANA